MKKRHLLIPLAVIAAALLLLLPGTALAAYETPTTVTIPAWGDQGNGTYWDLDTASLWTSLESGSGAEMFMPDGFDEGGYFVAGPCVVLDWWGGAPFAPVSYYLFAEPDGGAATRSFDSITYADLSGLSWQTDEIAFSPSVPFVVETAQGNYFKLMCVTQGWTIDVTGAHPHADWVWDVQKLVPSDPSTMLADLKGFIASPTVGTIKPAVGKALVVEVNVVSAALTRHQNKAAVLLLKAMLIEVKALPARMISADAKAGITSQVNAIIAAINQT